MSEQININDVANQNQILDLDSIRHELEELGSSFMGSSGFSMLKALDVDKSVSINNSIQLDEGPALFS